MKFRTIYVARIFAVLFAGSVLCGTLSAADVVRRRGEASQSQSGTITGITATSVTIKRGMTGATVAISADEVTATQFDAEPPALAGVRAAVQGSRFPEALENAAHIDPQTLDNPWIVADYDYFVAYAKARLALSDRTARRAKLLEDAANALTQFLRNHSSSYHFFPLCELLAEVRLALGEKEKAAQAFVNLSRAPWPQARFEGKYRLGCLHLDKQPPDADAPGKAKKLFQEILDDLAAAPGGVTPQQSETVRRFRTLATIALARCMIREGEIDSAVERLEALSETIPPEETREQAALYMALGEACETSERPKDAILAYLHVDVLFPAAKEERNIALRKLADLWRVVGRPERAREVERSLKDLEPF